MNFDQQSALSVNHEFCRGVGHGSFLESFYEGRHERDTSLASDLQMVFRVRNDGFPGPVGRGGKQ